jgi:hypothetical protein
VRSFLSGSDGANLAGSSCPSTPLFVSVCELETQILLAGDLGFIEKGELGTAKKDIAEIERM